MERPSKLPTLRISFQAVFPWTLAVLLLSTLIPTFAFASRTCGPNEESIIFDVSEDVLAAYDRASKEERIDDAAVRIGIARLATLADCDDVVGRRALWWRARAEVLLGHTSIATGLLQEALARGPTGGERDQYQGLLSGLVIASRRPLADPPPAPPPVERRVEMPQGCGVQALKVVEKQARIIREWGRSSSAHTAQSRWLLIDAIDALQGIGILNLPPRRQPPADPSRRTPADPGSTPSTRLPDTKHSPPASGRTSSDPSFVSVLPHERP